ncbi:MAG: hypothetical protein H5T86_00135 [Armatimonadetes bacterium]|nr:hypothetical protein [Armatimonadota bacterium]
MSAREYLAVAEDYLAATENNVRAQLPNPAVYAAVHAVICANDAVCIALIGERSLARTHGEAVGLLKRACRGTPYEGSVAARARQLEDILSLKTEAEYSG